MRRPGRTAPRKQAVHMGKQDGHRSHNLNIASRRPMMLTSQEMFSLAAELTGAAADGDAESLAAIAWQLYGEAGQNLAEIGRLRAAIHAAWNRPQERASPAPAAA
jgi:hypothetical protein